MKRFLRKLAPMAMGAVCLSGCGPSDETVAPEEAEGRAAEWRISSAYDVESFLDCIEATNASVVSAHRGGPAEDAPENSLAAFRRTLAEVPAFIEFDVAASSDGVLFLMHDDDLERTTTGAGDAAAKTWADISELRLLDPDGRTSDERPPTFAEALTFVAGRTFAQIDFKRSARFEDVIDEVRRQRAEDRVILIAYTLGQARRLHRLAPDMKISMSMDTHDRLEEARAAGIPTESIIAFTGVVAADPDMNANLDAADIEVIFGTLGGARSIDAAIAASGANDRYAELSKAGVDVIATDRPIAAHRALAARSRAPTAGACGISSP